MTETEISLVKKKIEEGPIKLKDGYEIYALTENGEVVSPFIPLPTSFANRLRVKLLNNEDNIQDIIKVIYEEGQPLVVDFNMPNFSIIRRIKGILTSFLNKIDKKIEKRMEELEDVDVICMGCGETGFQPPLEYEEDEGYMFVCTDCLVKGAEMNDNGKKDQK